MKNPFKLGLLACVIAGSFSACDPPKQAKTPVDSLKADSLKKDSLAKVTKADSAAKPGAKADTTKQDTTKKK